MDQVEQWQTAEQGQAVTGLLELVPDPRLQNLVRQALSANPDLQQVRWQWQQSLAQLQVADGERLPTLEASVERQHNAGESKDTAQAGFRCQLAAGCLAAAGGQIRCCTIKAGATASPVASQSGKLGGRCHADLAQYRRPTTAISLATATRGLAGAKTKPLCVSAFAAVWAVCRT